MNVYYIGDFDQVKNLNLIDKNWKRIINQNREGRIKTYPEIIKLLKNDDIEKYQKLVKNINNLRRNGIFILKQGELEDYMGITKGRNPLGKVIKFCNIFSISKLNNCKEIDRIVNRIFNN